MAYRRRRPGRKVFEAYDQALQSRRAISQSRSFSAPIPARLFDWLRYPVQRRAFERLLTQKFTGFPWLADAWADYRRLEAEHEALRLVSKRWPAPQAAEKVREAGRRAGEAERRAKAAEYVLAYYERLFPWLTDFRSDDIEELLVVAPPGDDVEDAGLDPARKWLTEAEFRRLSTAKKYQLALDRYWTKPKTRWEIGRDYERFVGYEYEGQGFELRYQGIVEGFADLGRDLIATKGDRVEIVQCKYWSRDKTIHEKHVFQLFGTLTAYRLDYPEKTATGVFVTSTELSQRARQFADALEIRVVEDKPLEHYPCIKCNISRRSGEKIYHLPFDQQYDSTIVEAERLECYVSTVAEAERFGFRRAHRWLGTS